MPHYLLTSIISLHFVASGSACFYDDYFLGRVLREGDARYQVDGYWIAVDNELWPLLGGDLVALLDESGRWILIPALDSGRFSGSPFVADFPIETFLALFPDGEEIVSLYRISNLYREEVRRNGFRPVALPSAVGPVGALPR